MSALPTAKVEHNVRPVREESGGKLHTRVETKESNDRSDSVENKSGILEGVEGEEGTKVCRNWEPSSHRLFHHKVNAKLLAHRAAAYEIGNTQGDEQNQSKNTHRPAEPENVRHHNPLKTVNDNVPNVLKHPTGSNREENTTYRSSKRGHSKRQRALTLEPMPDDSQNGPKNHATADSNCEALTQEQLQIGLAFRDECGSNHEEHTRSVRSFLDLEQGN